jgi:hypothetical protein
MKDTNKENSQLNTLLNAYSIQEITSLFALIDEKILALHNCSSEDFLSLNASFKRYYKDSKIISENASEILRIITNSEKKDEIFNGLTQFHKQLSEHLNHFETLSKKLTSSYDKIVREIEYMFVPSNNLKQDLMTLKLLVANLKIDITISAEPVGKMHRKANDFNEMIIQTKSFFKEFYDNLNQLKIQLKQNSQFVSELEEKNSENIGEILIELLNSSNLFTQKYQDAQQMLPKLQESTEVTATNIGKIITNLQYHDIIRQKIEHIQQTHKEILNELNSVSNNITDEISQQIQVRCFVQIRDVAGLQAAQLIHANKEYQKAIEIISDKFLEVGNEMTSISDMCHRFIANGNNSSQSHFKDIIDKVERTAYFIDVYGKSLKLLKDRYLKSKDNLNEILSSYFELSDFTYTIEKNILRSIDNHQISEGEYNTINQIKNILKSMKSNLAQHEVLFENIKKQFAEADTAVVAYYKEENVSENLNQFSLLSEKIISFLRDSNEKVYKTIEENQILSRQVSNDIKSSLEQIKYYDFFDKTIEEIIGQLNEINFKLQTVESHDEEHKKLNLEHIKSKYTMQSEHVIHENISSEKNLSQSDIYSIDSTGIDEEDDNLELF